MGNSSSNPLLDHSLLSCIPDPDFTSLCHRPLTELQQLQEHTRSLLIKLSSYQQQISKVLHAREADVSTLYSTTKAFETHAIQHLKPRDQSDDEEKCPSKRV